MKILCRWYKDSIFVRFIRIDRYHFPICIDKVSILFASVIALCMLIAFPQIVGCLTSGLFFVSLIVSIVVKLYSIILRYYLCRFVCYRVAYDICCITFKLKKEWLKYYFPSLNFFISSNGKPVIFAIVSSS